MGMRNVKRISSVEEATTRSRRVRGALRAQFNGPSQAQAGVQGALFVPVSPEVGPRAQ